MTPRLKCMGNVVAKISGYGKTIEQAATSRETLQPAENEKAPRIYFLENEMARATSGVPGHSTLQGEMAIATTTQSLHAPVIRYVLKNCLVHPHGVEYAGGNIRKSGNFSNRLARGEVREVERAAYCMSDVSHQYFGHWLLDACSTALLPEPGLETILDVRNDWDHAKEYARVFDFNPAVSKNLYVRELTVYQDYSQGSLKRSRYVTLRNKVEKAFGQKQAPARPVYLRRGSSGAARSISNEKELMERLSNQGFTLLDIVSATTAEMHEKLSNAPMVVSIDGSHMNHLYLSMPAGGKVIMINPADRFTLTQAGYASATGLIFGFVVAEPTGAGYHVDIDRLLKTMDLMPA